MVRDALASFFQPLLFNGEVMYHSGRAVNCQASLWEESSVVVGEPHILECAPRTLAHSSFMLGGIIGAGAGIMCAVHFIACSRRSSMLLWVFMSTMIVAHWPFRFHAQCCFIGSMGRSKEFARETAVGEAAAPAFELEDPPPEWTDNVALENKRGHLSADERDEGTNSSVASASRRSESANGPTNSGNVRCLAVPSRQVSGDRLPHRNSMTEYRQSIPEEAGP
eukprot:6328088-Amphidinium_carterae.5